MSLKSLLTLKKVLFIVLILFLFLQAVSFAQTPKSVEEIEQIKQDTIKNLDIEMNNSINDSKTSKSKELELIDASDVSSKEKSKLKAKTEKRYDMVIQKLNSQFQEKKNSTIDYYDSLIKEMKYSIVSNKSSKPVISEPIKLQKKENRICLYPNGLVKDLWKISTAYKYVGTIKFYAVEGMINAKVNFNMYNTWEDTENLIFDGCNLSFDYSNQYGDSTHFKGCINRNGRLFKGVYLDKVTNKKYSWKAYR